MSDITATLTETVITATVSSPAGVSASLNQSPITASIVNGDSISGTVSSSPIAATLVNGGTVTATITETPVTVSLAVGNSGDVVGPASAVNNNFAAYNGTTGKLIKDSGVSSSSFEPADATIVKTGNANWIDLTDGGATTLHSHTGGGGSGDVLDSGIVVGQLTKGVTDSKHITAAAIIPPASNILTLTNAAAATLGLNITSGKTLTLTSVDNYTLTIPATGTAALLATANVFTAGQTMQTTDGSTVLDVKFSKAFAAIASATPDASDGGWSGYTLRQVINSSQITGASGAQQVRVSIETTGAANIGACYIGHAATSGDAYDFETTPVQVTFDGGSSGYTGAGTKVSDAVNFIYSSGRNIVIALYASGSTDYMGKVTLSGWQSYYKAGNDTTTVNAGSYTTWRALTAMKMVEAGTPILTSILTADEGTVAVPSVTASSVLSTDSSSKLTAYTPTSNLPLLNGTQSFTGQNTFSAINVRRSAGAFGAGTYSALVLGDVVSGESTGAGMFVARASSSNAPFTAFMGFDGGSSRILYFGGGGWGAPDVTRFHVYTAPSYSETLNTGLIRLEIGPSNGDTPVNLYNHNSTNNAVADVLALLIQNPTAATGGADGYGAGLVFYIETATDTTVQKAGRVYTVAIDNTNASRKYALVGTAWDTAEREGWRVEASGTAAKIGFYGVTPIVRAVLATGAGATVDNVITALQNLGLVKQS